MQSVWSGSVSVSITAGDVPIIHQNLPISFWEFSQNKKLFLKTKPFILNNNFTLNLAENHFAGWIDEHYEQMIIMRK